jgi:hypothetical protein
MGMLLVHIEPLCPVPHSIRVPALELALGGLDILLLTP